MRLISFNPTFAGWQEKAREALANEWPPESIEWQEGTSAQPTLDIFETSQISPQQIPTIRVPKRFVDLAKLIALHSSSQRWSILYRVLWRLTHGESRLLENPIDADALELRHFEKEVAKDAYRMTAFLRFREVTTEDGPWFVAWYEPEHDTVELNKKFFTDRFANMRWSILTPKRCMHWDRAEVSFTNGVDKSEAPKGDDVEGLWISYYSSIFNPARLKVRAMQAQLLKRNWKNLPEAVVIEPLVRNAKRRTGVMIEKSDFQRVREADFSHPQIPRNGDWKTVRDAAASCRACPLWKNATCTVFGEGALNAQVILIGEQPGDQEDRLGRAFVGPAGQVLDRALATAGIERTQLYVTNAVKHFKFEPRGKRRIHKTSNAREIAACRPWLETELDLIKPKLVVALGVTASHALFGEPLKISESRGSVLESSLGYRTLVTVHPSSLLRLPEPSQFDEMFDRFVSDLLQVKSYLS